MLNFLFRLNNYFDKSVFTLIFLLTFIISAQILLYFNYLLPSILIYILLVFLVFFRSGFLNIKFDKSRYSIPQEGEIILVKKEFYWNGRFLKYPENGPEAKPWVCKIHKGSEFKVIGVKEYDYDWKIYLKSKDLNIELGYFETRRYWKSKSDLRNKILNKIGI